MVTDRLGENGGKEEEEEEERGEKPVGEGVGELGVGCGGRPGWRGRGCGQGGRKIL